jgi:hypothetical protein
MPATKIRYFAFIDTSGARDLTPTAAVDASKCDFATKMPGHGVARLSRTKFGIVYSAMLHRPCTHVECGSYMISAEIVLSTGRARLKRVLIAKNYSRAYLLEGVKRT